MTPNDYDQNPATSFYYVFMSIRTKKKLKNIKELLFANYFFIYYLQNSCCYRGSDKPWNYRNIKQKMSLFYLQGVINFTSDTL